jgi:hypothetical protein
MGKKLGLSELKVQSFVTSLNDDQKNKVKAALSGWICPETACCVTHVCTDEDATCTQFSFDWRCYKLSLGQWTNCGP